MTRIARVSADGDGTLRFLVLQIEVLSNWGNSYYTCLYRIPVHGPRTHLRLPDR
ncbi:hypothetical protein BCR43DRAFT_94099 [Syncephalastrum racemosum]|uniref:SUN domain-containing protein n=1 Tax=Syncephalastrum racemosum TaxID=13706 RepID=A0A1X2H0T2_SYNRA|nr:hypothetical protein BCR43DRAFT_94099 [Syncephalastrum racemosum]